jgi:hypothetical protein
MGFCSRHTSRIPCCFGKWDSRRLPGDYWQEVVLGFGYPIPRREVRMCRRSEALRGFARESRGRNGAMERIPNCNVPGICLWHSGRRKLCRNTRSVASLDSSMIVRLSPVTLVAVRMLSGTWQCKRRPRDEQVFSFALGALCRTCRNA